MNTLKPISSRRQAHHSPLRPLLLKGLLYTALAYIALLPHFYEVYNPENRRALNYGREAYAAIALSVTTMGIALAGVFGLLDWLTRKSKVWRPAADTIVGGIIWFLLLRSGVGLLLRGGLLPPSIASLLQSGVAKGIYYLAVPGILIALKSPRRMRHLMDSTCALLVAAMLYGLGSLFFFRPADEPMRNDIASTCQAWSPPSDALQKSSPLPDVLIFIFDEWEYAYAYPEGDLRPSLTNLQALASTATTYHQARSLGSSTLTSMTRFLFQNDPAFVQTSYPDMSRFMLSGKSPDGPSLFDLFPDDYFKIFLGVGFDYRRFLGNRVHYVQRYDTEGGWRNFHQQYRTLLRTQIDFIRHFTRKWSHNPDRVHRIMFQAQQDLPRDVSNFFTHMPSPVAGVFHISLPHFPYAWNRNGLKTASEAELNHWISAIAPHTEAGYIGNMEYVDTLIGQFMKQLKQQGRFDSSLVIITSDHGWRYDPHRAFPVHNVEDANEQSPFRHVVCWIKHPGQHREEHVTEPFSLGKIQHIIAATLSENAPRPLEE
jgi:hypothetical protein